MNNRTKAEFAVLARQSRDFAAFLHRATGPAQITEKERAELARFFAKERKPSPKPIPQPGYLPALGELEVSNNGEYLCCHACGDWFVSLAVHVRRSHRATVDWYRERYQLNRTQPLIAPAFAARSRAKQSAHLAAIRPPDWSIAQVDKSVISAAAGLARRLQQRIRKSEIERQRNAANPRPRKPPAPKPPDRRPEALAQVREAIHADPARDAAWRAAISTAKRTLTDEQIREIAALKGQATYQQVVDRYRVGTRTIARIWRGELAPPGE